MGSRLYSKRDPFRTYERRPRESRPKTFKTEEAANKWAKSQGIKEYTLFNLKNPECSTKKLRVISK